MLKILVAIDTLRPSKSAISHALHLAKNLNAHLVAVYLDDSSNRSYKSYKMLHDRMAISQQIYDICNEQDEMLRQESVDYFEAAAKDEKVNYTIHHDTHFSLNELTEESKYADLLIIERSETFSHCAENPPTHFIKNLLQDVHCPVLIVPELYSHIGKVLFLYDGGYYATDAVKKFNYLFSVLNNEPAEVLTVTPIKQGGSHLTNNHLMKEYMKTNYPNAVYTVLKGLPEIEIVNQLKSKYENELIVLGAYHRGKLSRIIKPSVIEVLMQELNLPMFINNN